MENLVKIKLIKIGNIKVPENVKDLTIKEYNYLVEYVIKTKLYWINEK